MKDFGYFGECDIPLSDEISVFNSSCDESFLISNDKALKAEIYAPELSLFMKKSTAKPLNKAKMLSLLYEARNIAFEHSKQQEFSKKVGKNVLIIGENRPQLKQSLENEGFKVIHLERIDFIYGAAGELCAVIDEGEVELDFALFTSPEPWALRQSGCFDISILSDDEVLDILCHLSPIYSYKNYIFYESDACLHRHRRVDICAKCAEVCPRVAILKNDEAKELEFSAIDCIACGACVSACPSSSIDNAILPRSAFAKIAKIYRGYVPLVCLENSNINITLCENILPFVLPNSSMLDFEHLLSLVLGSCGEIILHFDKLSTKSLEDIKLANEIFLKAFGKEMIYISNSDEELQKIQILEFNKNLEFYDFSEFGKKYELIADKLEFIASKYEIGEFEPSDSYPHGKIEINEDKCTLCASCVGACNTGALIADTANNAISFNESLCVGCEYCVQSCAESDTIFLKKGKIKLDKAFFSPRELARDELFACVECGKEFATKKSVERVASMLSGAFGGDEMKLKSLYCCSDCKAKLALMAQIKKGINDE